MRGRVLERVGQPGGYEHASELRALHAGHRVPKRGFGGQHPIGEVEDAPAQSEPDAQDRLRDRVLRQWHSRASLPGKQSPS